MLNSSKLIISTWACSKTDKFNKKLSGQVKDFVVHGYKTLPEIKELTGVNINTYMIDIPGERPQKEFMEYIRENFYTYAETYRIKSILVPASFGEFLKLTNKMFW
jgi:hypothetical protein